MIFAETERIGYLLLDTFKTRLKSARRRIADYVYRVTMAPSRCLVDLVVGRVVCFAGLGCFGDRLDRLDKCSIDSANFIDLSRERAWQSKMQQLYSLLASAMLYNQILYRIL